MEEINKTNKELALYLVKSLGWKVIPCYAEDVIREGKVVHKIKDPYYDEKTKLLHGYLNCSDDPEQVDAWWTSWENALIGVSLQDSGLSCLDLDNKNDGKNGFDTLKKLGDNVYEKLLASCGPATKTLHNGAHLIYKANKVTTKSITDMWAGIDVLAKGYIIFGGAYIPLEGHPLDAPLTELPEFFLNLIKTNPKYMSKISRSNTSGRELLNNNTTTVSGSAAEYYIDFWLNKAWDEADLGARHSTGVKYFAQMKDSGVPIELAVDAAPRYVHGLIDRGMGKDFDVQEVYEAIDWAYEQPRLEAAKIKLPWEEGEDVEGETEDKYSTFFQGNLSDTGNAMRFIKKYGNIIRYNPSFKWIIWTGKIWKINSLEIHKYAQDTAREIFLEAAAVENNKDLTEAISKWALQSLESYHLSKMLEEALPHLIAETEEFNDNHHWLLNVQNGIVDLKTGELLPHDKKYFFVRLANVSYEKGATCPKWEAFMEMIFPDEDVRRYIQKAVGFSLTGDSDEKSLFFLWGQKGNNGKSTFIRALLDFFGDYGKQTDIEVIMETNRGGLTPLNEDFYNSRFVATNEISKKHRWGDSQLKMLSGNDMINCNPKYRDKYSFPPTHKLWIFGNIKPKGGEDDEAFWNRMNLIAFDNPIPEDKRRPMTQVLSEFKAEYAGILNWSLAGLKMYQEEGLKQPDKIKRDTLAYEKENDWFGQFIEEECELGDDYKVFRVTKEILLGAFNNFLRENQEKPETKIDFTNKLKTIGVEVGGAGRSFYMGIKIINKSYMEDELLPFSEQEETPYWAK